MDHLRSGKEWDLARSNGGLYILPPSYVSGSTQLYRGDLENFQANFDFLTNCEEKCDRKNDCILLHMHEIIDLISRKNEEIENLIQERQDARKAKNFARADEIRNLLTEKGIILEDTREGVRWKRA